MTSTEDPDGLSNMPSLAEDVASLKILNDR